ncbi:MAG: hypothetical protein ACRC2A_03875 [Enterobacterales bacterium]|uniref:hypothetical protein n=1 Tax=Serratia sp. (in: enterobacteria) TaxID=616 RepID=UPI003F380152
MIVVLSGEGASDLGQCSNMQGICQIPEFVFGPMAMLIDKEIESVYHYSVLDSAPQSYVYISEVRLKELEVQRKNQRRQVSLVGKKKEQEMGYFSINAWMLGEEALRIEERCQDRAIAVMFRDCDGSRSAARGLWQSKWDSMKSGFDRSELGVRGVPMIPKPKSESWMLCAIKNNYQHCAALESLSGNDDAPNSAKARLTDAMHGQSSTQEQLNWLQDNGFDSVAVAAQMPSYQSFKSAMQSALAAI